MQSSRFVVLVGNREILNLSMVSGPVLEKPKGKTLDFHIFGVQNTKKMETNQEISQMLVSGALDQTKPIRKTAADIFAKSKPEKRRKKTR